MVTLRRSCSASDLRERIDVFGKPSLGVERIEDAVRPERVAACDAFEVHSEDLAGSHRALLIDASELVANAELPLTRGRRRFVGQDFVTCWVSDGDHLDSNTLGKIIVGGWGSLKGAELDRKEERPRLAWNITSEEERRGFLLIAIHIPAVVGRARGREALVLKPLLKAAGVGSRFAQAGTNADNASSAAAKRSVDIPQIPLANGSMLSCAAQR